VPVPSPLDMPQLQPAPPLPRSPEDLRTIGVAVAEAMTVAVRALRLAGTPWSEVARRLGVGKSAAHERYRHVDEWPVALSMRDGRATFRCAVTGVEFRSEGDLEALAGQTLPRVIDHQP